MTAAQEEIGAIGFSEPVCVDFTAHKRVLITGVNSYIGTSLKAYAAEKYSGNFEMDTISMVDGSWRTRSFVGYDAVFHVAGISQVDSGRLSRKEIQTYYAVNRDLAVAAAEKAKAEGVGQFVFMSSIVIYGDSARFGQTKMVTGDTRPNPANVYGDAKWQADQKIRSLADEQFRTAVVRSPMVYGKGCKGYYPVLAWLAEKLPLFPKVQNQRSMLHIDNLCEFLCQLLLLGRGGVFMPQNGEYTNTSTLVADIARQKGRRLRQTSALNPAIFLGSRMPGKIGKLVNKAFGSLTYDQTVSTYPGLVYRVVSLKESIQKTEG